jgi:hypothetical protein
MRSAQTRRTASIDEGLHATLGFLRKLALDPNAIVPADAEASSKTPIGHAIGAPATVALTAFG